MKPDRAGTEGLVWPELSLATGPKSLLKYNVSLVGAIALGRCSLLGLFCFDPAREPKTSAALWVPVIWLFFLGSRPPAMWLGLSYVAVLPKPWRTETH